MGRQEESDQHQETTAEHRLVFPSGGARETPGEVKWAPQLIARIWWWEDMARRRQGTSAGGHRAQLWGNNHTGPADHGGFGEVVSQQLRRW